MARYMFIARYASGGVKGVVTAGGSARRAAIQKMAEELGGRLERFDFAFGEDDVYATVELPDNKTAPPRWRWRLTPPATPASAPSSS